MFFKEDLTWSALQIRLILKKNERSKMNSETTLILFLTLWPFVLFFTSSSWQNGGKLTQSIKKYFFPHFEDLYFARSLKSIYKKMASDNIIQMTISKSMFY
jgi:hypothetical protein